MLNNDYIQHLVLLHRNAHQKAYERLTAAGLDERAFRVLSLLLLPFVVDNLEPLTASFIRTAMGRVRPDRYGYSAEEWLALTKLAAKHAADVSTVIREVGMQAWAKQATQAEANEATWAKQAEVKQAEAKQAEAIQAGANEATQANAAQPAAANKAEETLLIAAEPARKETFTEILERLMHQAIPVPHPPCTNGTIGTETYPVECVSPRG